MTIPVLMTPAFNRHDLLWRMLDSVDHPVDRTLIIQNGAEPVPCSHGDMVRLHAKVSVPPYEGLGYGGAINFAIMQNPAAPWWMWASNDVVFHPGHLSSVAQRMDEAGDTPVIITGGFTWGAVNRSLVDTVGLVDEWSFFPIYFDDNDYHRRCVLAGVRWIEDASGWTHGADGHQASLTIRSDPLVEAANHVSFRENRDAYLEKWGGLPGYETFDTPWNSGLPVWAVRPDMAGRLRRRW